MKPAAVVLVSAFAAQPAAVPRPARPVEPVAAIVDAFRTHAVVAVTAGHGDARGYAFGRALVTDPRLSGIVNDVVIEEGSARHQDVADRYVGGDDVPIDVLRRIWRETTQPGFGLDEPWERFFAAVRETNRRRPVERRIRVLLGDPPIDWDAVKTQAEHRTWIEQRDTYPADLMQREVAANHRRALLFYGQMHFQRKNIGANYESEGPAETLIGRLENRWGVQAFTIFTVGRTLATLQSDVATWPAPSVAAVRDTVLGAADFTFYYPSEAMGRFAIRDGKPDFSAPIPRAQWKTLRAEDQFDAVLYTGEEAPTLVRPSTARCADTSDVEEQIRRATVAGIGPAAVKRLCGL